MDVDALDVVVLAVDHEGALEGEDKADGGEAQGEGGEDTEVEALADEDAGELAEGDGDEDEDAEVVAGDGEGDGEGEAGEGEKAGARDVPVAGSSCVAIASRGERGHRGRGAGRRGGLQASSGSWR